MTIYLDHFFSDGTSQQIGSVEKIVLRDSDNLDFISQLRTIGSEVERIVTASPGKNGRVSFFGYKDRAGVAPLPVVPPMNPVPSLNERQYASIVSALVHMFGGAVTISGTELMAATERNVEIWQEQDPYMMKIINTQERQ